MGNLKKKKLNNGLAQAPSEVNKNLKNIDKIVDEVESDN